MKYGRCNAEGPGATCRRPRGRYPFPIITKAGSRCATTRSRPSWRQADAPTARWCSSSSRRECRRSAATPARSSCCSTWSTPGSRSRRSRSQFALCRGLGLVPMVRVPRGEYHFIARALDVGAMGVMVPMVGSAAEAAHIVSCTRYPPAGRRGAAFGFAHDDYQGGDVVAKMAALHERTMVIPQIETAEGSAQCRGDRRGARRRRAVARPLRPDQFHGHSRRSSSTRITWPPSRASSPPATRTARRRRSSPWTTTGRATTSPRASG